MKQYLKKLFSKFLPKNPEALQPEPMQQIIEPVVESVVDPVVANVEPEIVEPANVSPAYAVKEVEKKVYVIKEKKSKKKK